MALGDDFEDRDAVSDLIYALQNASDLDVNIDDAGGSITIDTDDGPIDVNTTGGGMTFAMHTDDVTGTDEEISGNWGYYSDWAGTAIALNQAPLDDPEYTLEYEVGSSGTGATSLSGAVDTTSDSDYEVNVTGDRSWDYTSIDDTTVTLTFNGNGTADLEVDHIYIEFTEVDTGATQQVSFYEGGKQ